MNIRSRRAVLGFALLAVAAMSSAGCNPGGSSVDADTKTLLQKHDLDPGKPPDGMIKAMQAHGISTNGGPPPEALVGAQGGGAK